MSGDVRPPRTLLGLPALFWVIWCAVLVLWTGRFVVPFLSLYLTTQVGVTASSAGAIVACYGFGGILASLGGGFVSDRYGRLRTIAASQIGGALLLVALSFARTPAMLAVVLFVYGAVGQVAGPALSALIADLVPPHLRERGYSFQVWAMNAGFAIGPVLAAMLERVSFSLIFYVEAATTILVTVVLAVVLRRAARQDASAPGRQHSSGVPSTSGVSGTSGASRTLAEPAGSAGAAAPVGAAGPVAVPHATGSAVPAGAGVPEPRPTARAAYATVLRDRVFLTFVAVMIGYTVVYFQSSSSLPIAMTALGLSVGQFSALLTINGVLLCLLQVPVIRIIERHSTSRVLTVAFGLTALGYLIQVFADQWWHFAAATVVWTLGELGTFPVASTVVANLAPHLFRGTYQGIYNLTWSGSHALAPLLGGLGLVVLGGGGLWLCCVGVLVGVIVAAHVTRGPRESREALARAEVPVLTGAVPD